jgi:hypothetical protein
MQRNHNQTVTDEFVLLVPASPSEALGEATFLPEWFAGSLYSSDVRPITLDEIREVARKLDGGRAAQFGALLALRGALERDDTLALGEALKRMENVYRLRSRAKNLDQLIPEGHIEYARVLREIRILRETVAQGTGMSEEEVMAAATHSRPGPKAEKDPRRLLSCEVSSFLCAGVKLVLWSNKGALWPAIYCPDAQRALYVHTFFRAPIGGLSFRICPYDGQQFFQERPNQEYCCTSHREAHRMARFRNNQKRKAAEVGKDRKNHGPKKAR